MTRRLWGAIAAAALPCLLVGAVGARAATVPAGGLPDHRAYEQVSPVDKNGSNIGGAIGETSAAPDGSAINFFTTSGIPGGEGAQEYPTYVARRGADGWVAEGMLMPASSGAVQVQILGWDPDLTSSFQKARNSITEPSSLRRMTLPGGTISTIPGAGGAGLAYVGQSSGGELVVFESPEEIGSLPAEPWSNVYGWDPSTGQVSLISVNNEEESAAELSVAGPYEWFNEENWEAGGANGFYYTEHLHVVAADGSGVIFTADAEPPQIFLRHNPMAEQSELDGEGECTEALKGCTVEVSASQRQVPDPEGPQPAQFQYASVDDSTVFFTSAGKLTDDATTGEEDQGSDLYRYDAGSGTLEDLTVDPDEALDPNGAEVLGAVAGSEDGSYLYFLANGVLGNGASQGAVHGTCAPLRRSGASAAVGTCNLYVWHDGHIEFIAPLHPNGTDGRSDIWDISPTGQSFGFLEPTQARVTPDGRTVVFRSIGKLTDYENEGVAEYYRHVYGQEGVTCLTCDPTGAPPLYGPSTSSISAQRAPQAPAAQLSRNLSTSGDRFFFETSEALVAGDTNGDAGCTYTPRETGGFTGSCQDVYEWEAPNAGEADDTCTEANSSYVPAAAGCISLISTGTATGPAYFAAASDDGDDAFFYTGQSLVAQDRDELVDIYDARIGGGIASQEEDEAAQCAGEACKGSSQSAPQAQAPRNAATADEGNATPLKCRKGFVKKHDRCAKKKARKGHHRHRRHRKKSQGKKGSTRSKATGKGK